MWSARHPFATGRVRSDLEIDEAALVILLVEIGLPWTTSALHPLLLGFV